jgi:hypothetical protein
MALLPSPLNHDALESLMFEMLHVADEPNIVDRYAAVAQMAYELEVIDDTGYMPVVRDMAVDCARLFHAMRDKPTMT